MNELQITQWLEQALQNPRLKLQVKTQPIRDGESEAYALVVMINRPADLTLDYEELTSWFQTTVSAHYPQVKSLALYSRPIGQHAADWKTQIKLQQSAPPDPVSPAADPHEPLDLSRFCFTDNRLLLTTDLPKPPGLLCQAILAFHRLTTEQKREVLPLLPTLFENPTSVSTVMLSVEAALWLEPLKTLNQHQLRLLSIWLSRYCFNPNTTLMELESVPPTPNRTTGQLKRSNRAPQMGVSLTLASFAGNLTAASAVTVGLLFGMVFVLSLAIIASLEGGFSFAYLIFSILITLAFNGLIFFLSPFLMDLTQGWLYGTEWVSLAEIKRRSPETAEVIERVCQKHKLKQPKLGLIRDQNPTAFTYGSLPDTARIVVSEGLFTYLEDGEVATVYAHELGHVIHWDFAVMTLVSTLVQITYLIYAYVRDIRGDSKAAKNIRSLAFIAYIFYVVGSYLLLYLSRVREYFADHFAAEVTGNPNALSRALVKIAYGIVEEGEREQDEETRRRSSRLLEGTRALGIYDAKAATTAGTAYRVAADPSQVGKVFLWDLFNPWAWWMELNSTHPLTGKRVRALGTYAEQLDLPVEFDMATVAAQGKHLNRQQLYGGFALDVVLLNAVWIGVILGTLLGIPALLAGQFGIFAGWIVLGGSVGQLLKTTVMYPSLNNPPALNVLKAMSNPYASPLRGLPMQLQGRVIGRGDAGYRFGSDLKFQDESGMIFLRYASRFGPLGNFLFGANQVEGLIGEQGSAVGWFRRGVAAWMDLDHFQKPQGQVVTSHHPFWQRVWGVIGVVVAIGLMVLL
ncbi:M48 family metalloprotease [Thermostichus vulcanus]|uniref:M48 family metalloprotease n=1 Tax=Thermostichus vulcanus str. 'Rupite' TaxID=2813851 RepID=A0ABT0CE34_THEVL|nr:M48 family metalloprotease [Thermostichus vulcanus]MCJ2544039.1 M48 family metalloprotease [Thermostichus vulcanus str. 'Rupite']